VIDFTKASNKVRGIEFILFSILSIIAFIVLSMGFGAVNYEADFSYVNKDGIEGVTFLGWEPMLQAVGLSEIAKGSHNIGLSVMVFTGYLLEDLTEKPLPGISDLLEATDILVDGPYIASQPETKRNWVGSANQRFYLLTDRYSPGIEYNPLYAHGFELRIYRDGTMRNNGWPNELETTDDSRKQEDHF